MNRRNWQYIPLILRKFWAIQFPNIFAEPTLIVTFNTLFCPIYHDFFYFFIYFMARHSHPLSLSSLQPAACSLQPLPLPSNYPNKIIKRSQKISSESLDQILTLLFLFAVYLLVKLKILI